MAEQVSPETTHHVVFGFKLTELTVGVSQGLVCQMMSSYSPLMDKTRKKKNEYRVRETEEVILIFYTRFIWLVISGPKNLR